MKIKHLLEADKGSKYLHSLIKKKKVGAALTSILDRNGQATTLENQICEEFVAFFKGLFGECYDRVSIDKEVLQRGNLVDFSQGEFFTATISRQEIK